MFMIIWTKKQILEISISDIFQNYLVKKLINNIYERYTAAVKKAFEIIKKSKFNINHRNNKNSNIFFA